MNTAIYLIGAKDRQKIFVWLRFPDELETAQRDLLTSGAELFFEIRGEGGDERKALDNAKANALDLCQTKLGQIGQKLAAIIARF